MLRYFSQELVTFRLGHVLTLPVNILVNIATMDDEQHYLQELAKDCIPLALKELKEYHLNNFSWLDYGLMSILVNSKTKFVRTFLKYCEDYVIKIISKTIEVIQNLKMIVIFTSRAKIPTKFRSVPCSKSYAIASPAKLWTNYWTIIFRQY